MGSGFCCKTAPCGFGEADAGGGCLYLVVWQQSETTAERYRCGKYAEIVGRPGAELSPAFGAGCCSPLFNGRRDAILVELRKR